MLPVELMSQKPCSQNVLVTPPSPPKNIYNCRTDLTNEQKSGLTKLAWRSDWQISQTHPGLSILCLSIKQDRCIQMSQWWWCGVFCNEEITASQEDDKTSYLSNPGQQLQVEGGVVWAEPQLRVVIRAQSEHKVTWQRRKNERGLKKRKDVQ